MLARDLRGGVGRAVVDDEHVDVRELGVELVEDVREVRLLVPGGDEHEGTIGGRHERSDSTISAPSGQPSAADTLAGVTEWEEPTFADVLEARRWIAPYLGPTPLFAYPMLDELLGTEVFVKHENHQPVGAFKVRGGVNLVAQLGRAERERGVLGASTGNHGQSIAYAARLFGVHATICAPEGANPVKVASMRGLGAEVILHGRDFDEARVYCDDLARERGGRMIHSGNEPLLISGVGTGTLEILEQEPGIQVIVVPIGGGSGAAGACIVAKAADPSIRVIGVQSEAAPAAYRTGRSGGRSRRRWERSRRALRLASRSSCLSRSSSGSSTTSCS